MRLLILIPLLLITGCSIFTREVIREVPVYERVQCEAAPTHPPIETVPINWQLATNKDGLTVLGLDGPNYLNLGMNMERIVEFIKVQRLITDYYKECIERHNKKGQP